MVEEIKNLPDNVIGFEAVGEITADDYESKIYPAVEDMRKSGKDIRFLYYLGERFQKLDFMAMVDDTLLGLKHLTHWEKVALVSDHSVLRGGAKAMGLILPGHVKTYSNAEYDKAVDWLKE